MTKATRRSSSDDAPRWPGYSDDERAAIQSAWPGATDEDVNDIVGRVEDIVWMLELDINQLVKASRIGVADMERELNTVDATIRALKDSVATAGDDDGPEPRAAAAAAALAPLIRYRNQLNLDCERLRAYAGDLATGMQPNAKKLFRTTLFDLVEQAWRRDGLRGPTFEHDYREFWEAIVLPPFGSPWVRRRVGDALSAGTFRAHVMSIQNREKSQRLKSE